MFGTSPLTDHYRGLPTPARGEGNAAAKEETEAASATTTPAAERPPRYRSPAGSRSATTSQTHYRSPRFLVGSGMKRRSTTSSRTVYVPVRFASASDPINFGERRNAAQHSLLRTPRQKLSFTPDSTPRSAWGANNEDSSIDGSFFWDSPGRADTLRVADLTQMNRHVTRDDLDQKFADSLVTKEELHDLRQKLVTLEETSRWRTCQVAAASAFLGVTATFCALAALTLAADEEF